MTAAKKTSSHPAPRKSTRKAVAKRVAELDPQQFDRIAKALADPTRFAMLERIAGAGEIACMDLADHCEVTPATVSHHLKELVYAGLVDARREAKFMIHTLRRDVWTAYLRELAKRIPAEV